MRTAATGLVLGYVVVTFLIAPLFLCAAGAADSYPTGVMIVLNRTGMLGLLQRGMSQAVEFCDHAVRALDDFLSREVAPLMLRQQN